MNLYLAVECVLWSHRYYDKIVGVYCIVYSVYCILIVNIDSSLYLHILVCARISSQKK